VFGAKYIDLIYPTPPAPNGWPTEQCCVPQCHHRGHTVFENLVGYSTIDPAKLNAVLGALSEGFRGQGERIGTGHHRRESSTLQLNPRS